MSGNNRSKFTIAIIIIAVFVLMVLFLSIQSALIIGFFVILIAYYINSRMGEKPSSEAKPTLNGSDEAPKNTKPENTTTEHESIFQTPRLKVIRTVDDKQTSTEPDEQK